MSKGTTIKIETERLPERWSAMAIISDEWVASGRGTTEWEAIESAIKELGHTAMSRGLEAMRKET